MKYTYQTSGTCSKFIEFEVNENNIVGDVTFFGGCNGNLKGIASLVKGMKAEDVIKKLDSITCGGKSTSCPMQLAIALKGVLNQ